MSLHRIKGVLFQEYFITKRSIEVIMDLFYFSLITIVMFGFVSMHLVGTINAPATRYLILGIILWEIVRVTQYSISVGALWNIWSRNLSNLFIAPLSFTEYMIAHTLSAFVKSTSIFIGISLIALFLFDFNIFQLGPLNLIVFFINLTIFAWSAGIVILGFIFRYGTRIQAFAWGLIYLFQPLTANFFPVNLLPAPLAAFAYMLPPTHVFEAARHALVDPSVNWNIAAVAFGENVFYFILSMWFFKLMFRKSKDSGQFARNEG